MSWVGNADRSAADRAVGNDVGPIAQSVEARDFDALELFSNFSEEETAPYLEWLRNRTDAAIKCRYATLSSPIHFADIYSFVTEQIGDILSVLGDDTRLTFHLSPGTPAMQAVWIIVAKTKFAAELLQSSRESGVETAQIPFDIAAEFVPQVLKRSDGQIGQLAAGKALEAPEFEHIAHRSIEMQNAIAKAKRLASHSVSILIEGETGTGKELFARAIHYASARSEGPFIAVNCGAIAPDLIESELFGHEKGAFTGASKTRKGHFESASGGTILLDEIGELPLAQQVKLLRVLQEGQIVRVGSSESVDVDVRVIAATQPKPGSRSLRGSIQGRSLVSTCRWRHSLTALTRQVRRPHCAHRPLSGSG